MNELNNLGTFASIDEVWKRYPEGGREGDYLTANGDKYCWDKYDRCWVYVSNGGKSVDIFQGESLSFALSVDSEEFDQHYVSAILASSSSGCNCADEDFNPVATSWDNIDFVNKVARWELSSEQSSNLLPDSYMLEVAIHERGSGAVIKAHKPRLIHVFKSYTL